MKNDNRRVFDATIKEVKPSKWLDNFYYITADTAFGEVKYSTRKKRKVGEVTHIRQQKNKIAWDPIKWEEC